MRIDKNKLIAGLSDEYIETNILDYRAVEMHIKKITGTLKACIVSNGGNITITYTDFNKFNMAMLDLPYLTTRTEGGDGNKVNKQAISVKWRKIDSMLSELTYKRHNSAKFKINIEINIEEDSKLEDLTEQFELQVYAVIDFRDKVVHEFMFNMLLHGVNLYKYEEVIINEPYTR